MLQRFRTNCKCGNFLKIEFEVGSNGVQIHCQCGELLVEYLKDVSDSPLETLNQAFQTEIGDWENTERIEAKPAAPVEQQNILRQTTRQFGEYTLIQELGKGAMGKVYLACGKNGEKVALKVLSKPENSSMVDYFLREAMVLRQLQHKNIVKMRGCGNSNGMRREENHPPGHQAAEYLHHREHSRFFRGMPA